ncbi:hypothetical protein QBC43DRAFT_297731 [Cladorrhinum sp. PSN259]|nr:hypothetical protein QBC43DRAFT_297731 [Cladorrhinum sp. PSN259]
MTEIVATSSQQRQQNPPTPTGPLTRSAMSGTRSAGGAGSISAPLPSPSSHYSSQQQQPRGPITRKRAASINTEEANNRQKIPHSLNLSSPSSASPRPFDAGGSQLVCLCAPEPKVPRPRNAFILYRQHHQATVVQENPGLANPDISKIIGERWRDESEEVKNTWKQLAEEEKLRHQVQFPGYRYQPRRGNKGGAPSGRPPVAPGEDPSRCPKCGGRYIATPRTPSTPFMTPTAARPGLGTPYGPPQGSGPYTPHPSHGVRSVRPPWGPTAGSLYDIHEGYEGMSSSEAKRRRYSSTGGYGNYNPMPSSPPPLFVGPPPPGHQHQARQAQIHQPVSRHSSFSNPPTPGYGHSLPPPSSMLARVSPGPGPGPLPGGDTRGSGPMPPPPRPGSLSMGGLPPGTPYPHGHPQQYPPPHSQSSSQQHQRSPPHQVQHHRGSIAAMSPSDFDESLRLPPLQTHLPNSPGSEPSALSGSVVSILNPPPSIPSYGSQGQYHNQRERDAAAQAQACSVEAMVMSISYMSKLRVLEKISPPLSLTHENNPPPPSSSPHPNRGPIIAVEGPDARLCRQVSRIIESALANASSLDCEVRTWEDPSILPPPPPPPPSSSDINPDLAPSSSAVASRHGSISSNHSHTPPPPTSSSSQPRPTNHFAAYLQTISSWHLKSSEMIRFITTGSYQSNNNNKRLLSSSSSTASSSNPSSQRTRTNSLSVSSATGSMDAVTSETGARHALPAHHHHATHSSPTGGARKLPIALIPTGYSLTLSDRFAVATPINDSYAPVDHWQWMATLWRGVAGADLVVHVRGGYLGSSEEGTVEVRSGGLIDVRVVGGTVEEGSTLGRRLKFEVEEWVRGGGWGGNGNGSDGNGRRGGGGAGGSMRGDEGGMMEF